MPKDNKPEDLESTIRLDMTKIASPYDAEASTDVDSIEDIFNSEEFANEPTISYDIPEETFISAEENIDFDDLTKEMNELSNEFDHNIQKEKAPQTAIVEDKPIKEKVATNVEKPIKKEAAPKASPSEDKQGVLTKSATPSTDKKESKPQEPKPQESKQKEASPAPKKQQPASAKSSNGIGVAMLGISLIALVAGLTGVWTSMSSQSQIDSLSAQLSAIQSNQQSNQPNSQQSELIAVQKQLISLKQTVDSLKVKPETQPVTSNAPANIVEPVAKISPAVITPVTPIKEVKPVLHKNTWNVIISSHDSMKKAKRAQQREAIKGMQTSIVPVVVKGNHWYRIVATNFADKQQAMAFTHKLKKQGIADAWIQYNK